MTQKLKRRYNKGKKMKEKKVIYLLQARLGSSRLPGKVLLHLYKGNTVMDLIIQRLLTVKGIAASDICLLTTTSKKDERLIRFAKKYNLDYYMGSENNVFLRFQEYLKNHSCKYFYRICCDNPLIDPEGINNMNKVLKDADHDYITYADFHGVPSPLLHYGLFVELINYESFRQIDIGSNKKYQEHVSPVFYENDEFDKFYLEIDHELQSLPVRLTLDTKTDLENIKFIIRQSGNIHLTPKEIISILRSNPEILSKMEEAKNENKK
jgi:spore coat polysaccharide biosynthesis protein SpsF